MTIKFPGEMRMKKLKQINFMYDDGTSDAILDPRAAVLFQSRLNSSGMLSGIEDFIVSLNDKQEDPTKTNDSSN